MLRLFWLLMLIGWMLLIFIRSNEAYQAQDIRPLLAEWFPPATIDNWLPHMQFHYSGELLSWREPYILLEFIFRKGAHVTEYAILTLLCLINIQMSAFKSYNYLISPSVVMLYAASDEWHQSFVSGRTGHAIDVAVDSIGMLVVMVIWLAWKWGKRIRLRKKAFGNNQTETNGIK